MPLTIAAAVVDWPADIEDEQHRPAAERRDVGARAGAAVFARNAVEEPHEPFANDEVGFGPAASARRARSAGHRPTVEIDAVAAAGDRVKGRDRCSRVRISRAPTATPSRASARMRPSVSVVLPAPERGAAMTRPAPSRRSSASIGALRSRVTAKGASASRKRTISPIATMAGAARPCGLRLGARASASVVTSTRWRGVVASRDDRERRVAGQAARDQRRGDRLRDCSSPCRG